MGPGQEQVLGYCGQWGSGCKQAPKKKSPGNVGVQRACLDAGPVAGEGRRSLAGVRWGRRIQGGPRSFQFGEGEVVGLPRGSRRQ